MKPSGPRHVMRSVLAGSAALLTGCASVTVPSIHAPWEAAENPHAEPDTAAAGISHPRLQWERIGSSIRGKPIHAATIGNGPRRIYVLAGIRGDESEGPAAARAAAEQLFGGSIEREATIRIIPDANPDGAVTRSRTNTRGVELGRNWPAKDWVGGDPKHGTRAGSELETVVVQKDLDAFKPDLVITLGSSARGPVVTLEGANSKLAAYEFASGARSADPRWRVVLDRWKPDQGSPESYIVLNMRKPLLSVELQRGRQSPDDARALQLALERVAAAPAPSAPSAAAARK